jgi:outer membrane protein assembly factor BamB
LLFCTSLSAADWPTYRGNSARTGSIDDKPGPKQPKVLWVHATKENFVGAPAASEKLVYAAALGAFNTGSFSALDPAADAKQRLAWAKTPPVLKLPTVASPAIASGMVYFGDGMHQNSGATLYAASANSGTLLWRHTLQGELIHMEGGPTVAGGKLFVGAGHGGVLCLDVAKLSINGKEAPAEEIRQQLEAEWKKLQAAYEEEKKKDPDFAIPPSEDALPKVSPKVVWQQGAKTWHVDAPVAVNGNQVLVASSYLDQEKSGLRAILSLDAATGDKQWETPLDQNPWAGATVIGDLAVCGTSNIRYEPKDIPKARGLLVALDLKTGDKKWTKKLPGGVVSSVAASGNVVLSSCTDGKVRASDLSSGDEKWSYAASGPLFAGPAVAGGVVYAGDLTGVVHAINLADGKGLWKLDLNTAGLKNARIYGAPIVHGGKIYVGTCNLEATAGQQGIVCIGE